MKTTNNSIEVYLPSIGRDWEGHEEIIEPAHNKAWRDATRYAAHRTYTYDGREIDVEIDWSVVARWIIEKSERIRQLQEPGRPSRRAKQSHRGLSIPVGVTAREQTDSASLTMRMASIVTYQVSNMFLAMNIAAPGSADFSGLKVICNDHLLAGEIGPLEEVLQFAAFDYDFAWTSSLDGAWPTVTELPVDSVFRWLAPLEKKIVQIAKSPQERVALSMLQLARMESSPNSVIWVCCALEAMFETRVGQSGAQLNQRIGELLGADPRQSKELKAALGAIYKLRNAFAHGGLAVPHPYLDEHLDKEVQEKMGEFVNAHCDGVRIVLACVQELVRRQWLAVSFDEQMRGVENGS